MRKVADTDIFIDSDLVCYRYMRGTLRQCPLYLDTDGYLQLHCVGDDGRARMVKYHRVIALAFIPNPENLPTVDHINRIKTDNRIENLRWASYKTQALNTDRTQDSMERHNGLHCKNFVNGKHVPTDETREWQRIQYRLTINAQKANERRRYARHHDKRLAKSNEFYKQKSLTHKRVLFADGSHHWVTNEEAEILFSLPSSERIYEGRVTPITPSTKAA